MTSEIAAAGSRPESPAPPVPDALQVWRPARTRAGAFGLGGAGLCLLLALVLLALIVSDPEAAVPVLVLALLAVGGLGGGVLLALWALRYWFLTYELDRNALTVRWPGGTVVCPLGRIERVEAAPRLGRKISRRRLAWPGYHLGRIYTDAGAEFTVCSAMLFGRHLLVHVDGRAYALAPEDPAGFLVALEALRALGPLEEVRVPSPRPRAAWRALLADRMSRDLFVAALLLSAALLLFLVGKYPSLSSRLPMHWNAAGQVDWVAETREIFYLPAIGLVTLLVNVVSASWVVRREPMAARLLSGASVFGQFVLWVAVLGIIS